MIDVGVLIVIEDQNDDDAALVRGVVGAGRRVMPDVQLADWNRAVERLTNPDRDLLGATRGAQRVFLRRRVLPGMKCPEESLRSWRRR